MGKAALSFTSWSKPSGQHVRGRGQSGSWWPDGKPILEVRVLGVSWVPTGTVFVWEVVAGRGVSGISLFQRAALVVGVRLSSLFALAGVGVTAEGELAGPRGY